MSPATRAARRPGSTPDSASSSGDSSAIRHQRPVRPRRTAANSSAVPSRANAIEAASARVTTSTPLTSSPAARCATNARPPAHCHDAAWPAKAIDTGRSTAWVGSAAERGRSPTTSATMPPAPATRGTATMPLSIRSNWVTPPARAAITATAAPANAGNRSRRRPRFEARPRAEASSPMEAPATTPATAAATQVMGWPPDDRDAAHVEGHHPARDLEGGPAPHLAEEHRRLLADQRERGEESLGKPSGEALQRLVDEQHPRVGGQGAGQGQAASLQHRQLAGGTVRDQRQRGEQLVEAGGRPAPATPPHTGQAQVLGDGQPLEQRTLPRHEGEAGARPVGRRGPGQLPTPQPQATLGLLQAGQAAQQELGGAGAGAVADEAHDLAAVERQIEHRPRRGGRWWHPPRRDLEHGRGRTGGGRKAGARRTRRPPRLRRRRCTRRLPAGAGRGRGVRPCRSCRSGGDRRPGGRHPPDPTARDLLRGGVGQVRPCPRTTSRSTRSGRASAAPARPAPHPAGPRRRGRPRGPPNVAESAVAPGSTTTRSRGAAMSAGRRRDGPGHGVEPTGQDVGPPVSPVRSTPGKTWASLRADDSGRPSPRPARSRTR